MYQKESDFVKAVMLKLKKKGCWTTRIETATTVNGMPDLYVAGHGDDYFIEFKNCKSKSIFASYVKIPWRPGQQAWAANYKLSHTRKLSLNIVVYKCTWTFVACSDGVLLIRMAYQYDSDEVQTHIPHVFRFTYAQFHRLDISKLLRTHSHLPLLCLTKTMLLRDVLENIAELYAKYIFGDYRYDYDIPSAEILASTTKFTKEDLDKPCFHLDFSLQDYMDVCNELAETISTIVENTPYID